VLRLEAGSNSWSVMLRKGSRISGGTGGRDMTVVSPSGVAVDKEDNVYVVDSTARGVYVLPSTGQAPRLLAGDGGDGTRDGTSGDAAIHT
jgi:hypothetical protein